MGQKYRAHSPEYVIRLLRYCLDRYGISNFHFEDDNLTCDSQRFEKILDLIIKENLQIKWDAPNGVRVDSLNYNILKKIKQSGCVQLSLALESGSQRVLDEVIHKGLNLDHAINIVKCCKELKISANAFYVIGFPGETVNEIKNTINLAIKLYRKCDVCPIVMVATPLYGTELYEICIRDKLIKRELTCEELCVATQSCGEPIISTPDFSKEDTKWILNDYNKRFQAENRRHLIKHPQEFSQATWRTVLRLASSFA